MVELRRPGRMWRRGKVLFESYWLGAGLTRAAFVQALALGSKFPRIPASP